MTGALGKVWLVGAGPGDPDLITVRGLQVLREADVVLHDALSHPALLQECQGAQVIDVGKRFGQRSPPQKVISARLIELARQGKNVVRLKGGDPYLFARGAEEALALAAAGIPFEVVPGVSSPIAASIYAGFSLTHRDLSSSVTIITGSDRAGKPWSPESWQRLSTATDTLCILMGMRRIQEITEALLAGGRSGSTPVAVVQWGARPQQRVLSCTLSEVVDAVRREGLSNPAVVFVGKVVTLREQLSFYDSQPLFGKTIMVPRPEHQAQETARRIRERGAEPLLLPAIEIVDPPDPEALREAALRSSAYDWVVFTSANGVQRFFLALKEQHRDARAFGTARVAAIGPRTAEALAAKGVTADLTASSYVAESLAEDLLARGPLKSVLLPRALVAREVLPELLRRRGATVDVVPAYQTIVVSGPSADRLKQALVEGLADVVLFSSGSMVDAVVEALGGAAQKTLGSVTLASIGPVTTAKLEQHGLKPQVTASTYTIGGVLDALSDYFKK